MIVIVIAAGGLPANPAPRVAAAAAAAAPGPNATTDTNGDADAKGKGKGKPQAKAGERAGAPAPAKPAEPARPAVYTEHDWLRGELEQYRRSLVGTYKAHGKHGPWDDDAARFLDQTAIFFTYGEAGQRYRHVPVPKAEDLRAAAARLAAAGCDDPLITYCHGSILHNLDRRQEALEQVERAIPGLQATGYPAHRVFAAARLMERLDAGGGRGIQAGLLAEKYLEELPVGPLDGHARRNEYYRMSRKLNELPIPRRVEILDRLRNLKDVDPWVLDVLDGELHVERAWESRGSGTADSVTPQGWDGFHRYLGLARECGTRAWKLAPELPEAPTLMIGVVMGAGAQPGEGLMTWFERAEAAQFDHVIAYDRMFYALLPRWGGSYEDMYELGLRAVRTGRYDTEVPWQLVRAAERIGRDSGEEWGILRSRPGVYEQLCEVDDGYIAAEPEADKVWFRTHRAGLAWRAGKLAEAREQLDNLGDAWHREAFKSFGSRNPPAAVGQVYAQTGPQAAAVTRAEAAMARRDWAGSLREFGAARDALGKDVGRAEPYFKQRVTLLGRRIGLAEGRAAVDVQPDEYLTSWKVLHGKWRVNKKGELLGREAGEKFCYLLFDEPVGDRFEVSGRGEKRMHDSPPCVAICDGERQVTLVVFFPGTVTIYFPGVSAGPMQLTEEDPEFTVRLDGDKLTVRRGGKDVFVNLQLPPHGVPRDPRLALAVLNDVGDAAFTGLTVRRITGDAAEEGDGFE